MNVQELSGGRQKVELPNGRVWFVHPDAQQRAWLQDARDPDKVAGPFPSVELALESLGEAA